MTSSRYSIEGEELILCLYFNAVGCGYALMKNPIQVIEKGMINVVPADNTMILKKVKRLVKKLKPERIVIEDYTGNYSYKSERIIKLLKAVKRYTKQKGILLSSYSREQIRLVFDNWYARTRYEIALVISRNVEAYENILFEEPKYPKTEHSRSVLFDAASLGITHYYLS